MSNYTPDEQALIDVWDRHTASEFELRDADAAIETMTKNPVLIHVPVNTGATGKEPLRKFYAEIFIPQMPQDAELEVISRTIGQNRVVDEFILHLTHSIQMDWFIPGVAPTGQTLAVPHVGVIAFEDGLIASEHIYWDHATVLRQLGLLDSQLPVLGSEQVDRLLNPNAAVNQLIK